MEDPVRVSEVLEHGGEGGSRESQDNELDGAKYYRYYSARYSKDRLGDCRVPKPPLLLSGRRGKGTAVL